MRPRLRECHGTGQAGPDHAEWVAAFPERLGTEIYHADVAPGRPTTDDGGDRAAESPRRPGSPSYDGQR